MQISKNLSGRLTLGLWRCNPRLVALQGQQETKRKTRKTRKTNTFVTWRYQERLHTPNYFLDIPAFSIYFRCCRLLSHPPVTQWFPGSRVFFSQALVDRRRYLDCGSAWMPPMKVLACRGHVTWGAVGPTYLIGSINSQVTKVNTLKKGTSWIPMLGWL